jgi:hypothetical protein
VDQGQKVSAEHQISKRAKRIDFYISEWSIELLIQKMKNKTFVIPDYQRRFTWEPRRQSRFIESVLMGLPIPFLTFWEKPADGKLEIVDGSQRLRTLVAFVNDEFALESLAELTECEGFGFSDLLASRQLKFVNKSIRSIVLNEDADEQARSDLFDRINTSSKAAEPGEIRRGTLSGPFIDLVDLLGKNKRFAELAPVTAQDEKEGEREELVTRFFAYGDGLDGYKDRPAEFMFSYVKRMNERMSKDPKLKVKLEKRFNRMLEFVSDAFPIGFRKKRKKHATTTGRARFEAIAVGTDWALQKNPKLKPLTTASWVDDAAFEKILRSDGANNKKTLLERIEFVRNKLLAT